MTAWPPTAGGGDLGTDEAGTDHDNSVGTSIKVGTERQGIVEAAQHVYAAHLLGPWQRPATGAGGDHQAIDDVVTGVGRQGSAGEVEAGHPHTKSKVKTEILELLWLGEGEPVDLPLPRQHLFRQGRTVVRVVGFVTNQDDTTVELATA